MLHKNTPKLWLKKISTATLKGVINLVWKGLAVEYIPTVLKRLKKWKKY